MSLNGFKGVNQGNNNKCGAFALAAALAHLKGFSFPRKQLDINATPLAFSGQEVIELGATAFAESIYKLTGILNLDTTVRRAEYTNPSSNLNPPSALVYVASMFGLEQAKIEVLLNTSTKGVFDLVTVTGQSDKLFSTEEKLIQPKYGIVTTPAEYTAPPAARNAHLLLVGTNFDHWVTLAADATGGLSLYDSGTGYVGPCTLVPKSSGSALGPTNPLSSITYTSSPSPMSFAGLWISLSP